MDRNTRALTIKSYYNTESERTVISIYTSRKINFLWIISLLAHCFHLLQYLLKYYQIKSVQKGVAVLLTDPNSMHKNN